MAPLKPKGRWAYADRGVLDTRFRFFTKATMKELFESTEYVVERGEPIDLDEAAAGKRRLLRFLACRALSAAVCDRCSSEAKVMASRIALLHLQVPQPMGQQRDQLEIAQALQEQPGYEFSPISVSSIKIGQQGRSDDSFTCRDDRSTAVTARITDGGALRGYYLGASHGFATSGRTGRGSHRASTCAAPFPIATYPTPPSILLRSTVLAQRGAPARSLQTTS